MSFQLKLTGSAEIPFALDRDQNYILAGEFEEISRTESDDKDGSITTSFKMAPLKVAIEVAGKKIRLKTKNSNSVRFRAGIYRAQQERKSDLEPEDYYDKVVDRILVPDTLQQVLNILEL